MDSFVFEILNFLFILLMFAKSISTVVVAHYFIWTKELTQNTNYWFGLTFKVHVHIYRDLRVCRGSVSNQNTLAL